MPDSLGFLEIFEVLAVSRQSPACLPPGAGASDLHESPVPAISIGIITGQGVVPNWLATLLEVDTVVGIGLVAPAAPETPGVLITPILGLHPDVGAHIWSGGCCWSCGCGRTFNQSNHV